MYLSLLTAYFMSYFYFLYLNRYRILVKKNSEKDVYDYFKEAASDPTHRFHRVIVDAHYHVKTKISFRGQKSQFLTATHKPMIPGLLFIKSVMNARIKRALENLVNFVGFVKNSYNFVVPLSEADGKDVERSILHPEDDLDEEAKKLRKQDYVSVVEGPMEGAYGIITGSHAGLIDVKVRGKDGHEFSHLFSFKALRYLPSPPETHYLVHYTILEDAFSLRSLWPQLCLCRN
jgi:transcription antitermination factor NusG